MDIVNKINYAVADRISGTGIEPTNLYAGFKQLADIYQIEGHKEGVGRPEVLGLKLYVVNAHDHLEVL